MVKILYGVYGNTIDVTDICFSQLKNNSIITIPDGQFNRNACFTEILIGKEKSIFIIIDGVIREYDKNYTVKINTVNNYVCSEVKFQILYGISGNTVDVTDICLSKLKNHDNVVTIPYGDFNRKLYFIDPIHGVKKSIFVVNNDTIREYGEQYTIRIQLPDSTIKIKTACILQNLWQSS